ncbi:HEAT repeat domain-containing protein [Natrinema halophilum]|uniref:HEAT repeat domain-containing protein n=1 Tax=Natrinema halophilum TaxID=1699371 RepID=A0A7D5GIW1_9EURY|nr:HEAT repeat domain-containing protein [Natrinema halophilum]QLG50194.1 HEAT repeat domain-containing protein [Natrinema halophilum]
MSTQVPDDEELLETARNDPENVDLDAVVALFDAERGQVRNIALRCVLFVAVDDPSRVAEISEHVIERLDDDFPVAGSTAAAVLASIADDHPDAVRPGLPALVGKLDEHPPQTGYRAARALSPFLEEDPRGFVPEADALLDVLIDPPEVWAPNSAALQDFPPDQRLSITNTLTSRRNEIVKERARNSGIRELAAHALVEVTAREPDAVADRLHELSPALSNDPPIARAATIDAIANVAEVDPTAATPLTDALIARLDDDAEFVRAHAVRALGFAEAVDAVDPLRELADDATGDLEELAADTADWIAESH